MTARQSKNIEKTGKICMAIMAAAAVVVLCWQLLAEPCVQRQIDTSLAPVVDVLEYQTWLMMQTLTDEQLERADKGYTQSKKMKVKR